MPATATRKKNEHPSEPSVPSYREGDVIKVLKPDKHAGEIVGVLELDAEGGMVRTEFGWLMFAQIEPAPNQRTQRMTIDGEDAVVIDGTTGGIKDDVLVRPPLEDLVRSLAKANEKLGKATILKKQASEAHKDAQGAVNAVVDEIITHYGETNGQLPLGVTQSGSEDEDEEGDGE